jgi:hypothetical protein
VAGQQILEAVRSAAGPIEAIGANCMLDPEMFQGSTDNGYAHPFAGYFAGRGGVLGDAPAEVVTAVFQVFEPNAVKLFWDQGVAVHGARKGAELYADQLAAWARDRLKAVPGLERLCELGQKLIDATPGNGLPLYAGWKAMPLPDDTPARAMQILFTLRELQGGVHMAALTVAGLDPVASHLLNKGPEYCSMFGWQEPWPAIEHLKATREQVVETTNARVAAIWANALSPEEAAELAALTAATLGSITG